MPTMGRTKPTNSLPTVLPQRVNNFIPVDKYYRSAKLLIRQAQEYRAQHNELQLYTMLMRLASLIVETIPDHKDFSKAAPEYRRLRQALIHTYMQELEDLKLSLRLEMGADTGAWLQQPSSCTPDTVQITTSNLPELDWDRLAQPATDGATSQSLTVSPLASARSWSEQPQAESPGAPELPTFRLDLRSAGQAARDRHTLLPKLSSGPHRPTSASLGAVTYPNFEAVSLAPIDYGAGQPMEPSRQPDASDAVAGQPAQSIHSLMDEPIPPRPSLPLPPQEIEVHNQLAAPESLPEPGATCCAPGQEPAPPPPPPADEQPGAVSEVKELREVHVSMGLMEEFLAYARSNTRRGIESCGILAGVLDTKRGLFSISTLVVPKQEGTSDTVQALAEEEIFDVQDKRGLYPMGWIHTHPTQTCFLSSIDVHTQCGYQTMLEEAVAIVMAPSDRSKRCGIFRLSTPGGLKLVQKCQSRGFHMHPPTETGQPVYELCGHVYLNERLQHDVVDLR